MFSPTQPLSALPPGTSSASTSPVLGAGLSLMFAPKNADLDQKPAFFPSPESRLSALPPTSPALAPSAGPAGAEVAAAEEGSLQQEHHTLATGQPRAQVNDEPLAELEQPPAPQEAPQPIHASVNGVVAAEAAIDEEEAGVRESFREEYFEIVTELPREYERKFTLIRELEEAQQDSTEELRQSIKSFIAKIQTAAEKTAVQVGGDESAVVDAIAVDGEEDPPAPDAPQPEPSETAASTDRPQVEDAADTKLEMAAMHRALKAAIQAGEDKIELAQGLYLAVDRHIQRLDADLAQHEDSLVIGLREGTLPSHDAPSLSLKEAPGPTTSRAAIALGELPPYSASEGGQQTRQEQGLGKTGGKVGMSVDPNEPRYCFCNRVSFGEMIGCDNEDCKREWFHFGCVGIKQRPEGDWFCSECIKKGAATPAGPNQPPTKKAKRRRLY